MTVPEHLINATLEASEHQTPMACNKAHTPQHLNLNVGACRHVVVGVIPSVYVSTSSESCKNVHRRDELTTKYGMLSVLKTQRIHI